MSSPERSFSSHITSTVTDKDKSTADFTVTQEGNSNEHTSTDTSQKTKSSTGFLGILNSKSFSKQEKEKEPEFKKTVGSKKSGLVSGLQNLFKSSSASSKNLNPANDSTKHSEELENRNSESVFHNSALSTVDISESGSQLTDDSLRVLTSQETRHEKTGNTQNSSPFTSTKFSTPDSHEDFKMPRLIDKQKDTVLLQPTTSMTTTSVPNMHAGDARRIVDSLSHLAGSNKHSSKSASSVSSDHEYFPVYSLHAGEQHQPGYVSEDQQASNTTHSSSIHSETDLGSSYNNRSKDQYHDDLPWQSDSTKPAVPLNIAYSPEGLAEHHSRRVKHSQAEREHEFLSSSPKLSLSPVPDSAKIRCIPIPEPLLVRPFSRSSSSAGSGEFSFTERAHSPRSHGSPLATSNHPSFVSRDSNAAMEDNYSGDEHSSNRSSPKVASPLTNGKGWYRSRRSSLIDTVMNVNKFAENVRKPQDINSNDSDPIPWRRTRTSSYNGESSSAEWNTGPTSPLAVESTNLINSPSTLSGRFLVKSKRASFVDANFAGNDNTKLPTSKIIPSEVPKTRHRRVLSVSNVKFNRFQPTKVFTDNNTESRNRNALGIENASSISGVGLDNQERHINHIESKQVLLLPIQPTSVYSYSTSLPTTSVNESQYRSLTNEISHKSSVSCQASAYAYASKLYRSRVAKVKDWSRHKPSAETHWFNWIYDPPLAAGCDRPLVTFKKHREYLLWWNQVVDICYEILETPMSFDLPSTYEEFRRNKRLQLRLTPLPLSDKEKPTRAGDPATKNVFDSPLEAVPMSRAVSYSGYSSNGNGKVFKLPSLPSEFIKHNMEKDIRYRKRQCDQLIRELIEILNQFVEGTLNYVEEEEDADALSDSSLDDRSSNLIHDLSEFNFDRFRGDDEKDTDMHQSRSSASTPTISIHTDSNENMEMRISSSPAQYSRMDYESEHSPQFQKSSTSGFNSNPAVRRFTPSPTGQFSGHSSTSSPLDRHGSVVIPIAEDSFCPTPFLQKAMDFISIGQDILDIDYSKLSKGKMEYYVNTMTKIQNQWFRNNWPHKDMFSRLLTLMGYLNISIQVREAEKLEKEYTQHERHVGKKHGATEEKVHAQINPSKESKPHQKRRRARKPRSDPNKIKKDINELRRVVEEGQGVSIVMELTLNDVRLRYLSPAWRELMGSDPQLLLGHSIAEFLPDSDVDIFSIATSQLLYDDTQTIEVRFSLLQKNEEDNHKTHNWAKMEAKGILGYSDHINGEPSHTLWVIQPTNEDDEDTWIDSSSNILGGEDFNDADTINTEESAGMERTPLFRDSKMRNSENCSESGSQSGSPMPLQPLPPHVLCHICEQMVSPLFFETHSEHCTKIHQAERKLQACDDSLQETRTEIYEIYDTIIASVDDFDVRNGILEILNSAKHILDLAIAVKIIDNNGDQPLESLPHWQEISTWSLSTVDPGIQQLLQNVQTSIRDKLEAAKEMLSAVRKGQKAEAQWEAKMKLEYGGSLIDENNIEEFNLDQSIPKSAKSTQNASPKDAVVQKPLRGPARSRRPRLTLKVMDQAASPVGSPKSARLLQDVCLGNTPYSSTLGPTTPGPRSAQISIKDFEIIKPISKGAFGSVYLAKKRTTGEYFAIKVLKKSDMITKNQVMNVKAERKALIMQTDSPFVVKLYFTFQSKDYLYLVMEYLNGGDCAALIKGMGELPEEWARNYLAEVVLGLEYLHGKGIIHRDLKPDNLLIDQNGHLKLTDFGLSRIGFLNRRARNQSTSLKVNVSEGKRDSYGPLSPYLEYPSSAESPNNGLQTQHQFHVQNFLDSKRNSITSNVSDNTPGGSSVPETPGTPLGSLLLTEEAIQNIKEEEAPKKCVGTPDYLAPESILGTQQDAMVDWWALGVILYEFIYGIPPFNADSPEKVFENILSRNIDWHEDQFEVSPEARDLMEKLMCTDVEKRLGVNGIEEVKNHPFFAGINWDTLLTERPAFIPQPDGIEDTDYFDGRGASMAHFDADEHPELCAETEPEISQSSTQSASIDNPESPSLPSDNHSVESNKVDFGNFSYKNLEVLAKANDDVIRRLKSDPTIADSTKRHSMIHIRSNSEDQNLTIPISRSRNVSVPLTQSSLAKSFGQTMSSSLPSSRMSWCGRPSSLNDSSGESPKRQANHSRPRTSSLAISSKPTTPHNPTAHDSLSRKSSNGNHARLKCLIVDDNAISAKLLERILEKLHCSSVVCYNGAEAIRCCMGKVKFDIIFMDIKMPIIDGFTAARMIKSTKNLNQETPIIAVTAYERNVPQAGLFDVILSKIVTKEKIGSTLKQYCSWSPNRPRNRG